MTNSPLPIAALDDQRVRCVGDQPVEKPSFAQINPMKNETFVLKYGQCVNRRGFFRMSIARGALSGFTFVYTSIFPKPLGPNLPWRYFACTVIMT